MGESIKDNIRKAGRTVGAAAIGAASLVGLPIEQPTSVSADTQITQSSSINQTVKNYNLQIQEPYNWGEKKDHVKVEAAEPGALDWELPGIDGRFFTQRGQPGKTGFVISNDPEAPMWDIYRQYGGIDVWGPPISHRFVEGDMVNLATQRGIFEYNIKTGEVSWKNIFDIYADKNISLNKPGEWIPDVKYWDTDQPLPWGHTIAGPLTGTKEANHDKLFEKESMSGATDQQRQILKNAYYTLTGFGNYDTAFKVLGLGVSVQYYPELKAWVLRCQRGGIQLWEEKKSYTYGPNEATLVLGGEVALRNGSIIPTKSAEPLPPPGVGGPITTESVIATTQVVDKAQSIINGQTYTIESRVSPNAKYKESFTPETKQQLADLVAKDGLKNGFKNATIVILNAIEERPSDLSFGEAQINLSYYNGGGSEPNWVTTGIFAFQRVGDRVILYFAPAPNLPLQDPAYQRGVNESFARRFFAMTISGGDADAVNGLIGREDHQNLITKQSFNLIANKPI